MARELFWKAADSFQKTEPQPIRLAQVAMGSQLGAATGSSGHAGLSAALNAAGAALVKQPSAVNQRVSPSHDTRYRA